MKADLRYEIRYPHAMEKVMAYGTNLIPDLVGWLPDVAVIDKLKVEKTPEGFDEHFFRFHVKPTGVLPPWITVILPRDFRFTYLERFVADTENHRVLWHIKPEGVPGESHGEGITRLEPNGQGGTHLILEGAAHLHLVGRLPAPDFILEQAERFLIPMIKSKVLENLHGFYKGLGQAMDAAD